MTKPLKKSSITDTTKLGGCRYLEVDFADRRKVTERKPRQRRGYQNKHGNNADQEGKLAFDASLRLFQFI